MNLEIQYHLKKLALAKSSIHAESRDLSLSPVFHRQKSSDPSRPKYIEGKSRQKPLMRKIIPLQAPSLPVVVTQHLGIWEQRMLLKHFYSSANSAGCAVSS